MITAVAIITLLVAFGMLGNEAPWPAVGAFAVAGTLLVAARFVP